MAAVGAQESTGLSLWKMRWTLTAMAALWALAAVLWLLTGRLFYLIAPAYVGLLIGVGLGLWLALPQQRRNAARRATMILIGGFIWLLAAFTAAGTVNYWGGFPGAANVQIEGLFISFLSGSMSAALAHYMIAKLAGPFFFGRIWCGWACWFAMVFDQLPFKRSRGDGAGSWGWLRYVHFGVSLTVIVVLWLFFGFSQASAWGGGVVLAWFLVGTALYYVAGITLAFVLKDNRAFCKYLCPVTVPLKLFSRFSLIKIKGIAANCNDCRACDEICPMDVHVMDLAKKDMRILSTECILCQQCLNVCDEGALVMSFGVDVAKN